jgi:hypothetical protein
MCNEKIDLFWQHLLRKEGQRPPASGQTPYPRGRMTGQNRRRSPPTKWIMQRNGMR